MKRSLIVLLTFAVGYITLAVVSYRQDSATWDEPQHLTAGYYALAHDDYRVDPEHPPLLRLWAALPAALMSGVRADITPPSNVSTDDWLFYDQFLFCHKFLYQLNDADRLLYAGRFMIVLLGVGLGVVLFAWVNEWLGFWPATATLAFYTLEPNLLAHARLVTTDFGATFFIFGAIYFAWRCGRRLDASSPTRSRRLQPAFFQTHPEGCGYKNRDMSANLAALVAFFALAMVSKFTAVLLIPVVLVLLRRWRVAAGAAVAMAVVSYATIWAAYGFRHAPAAGSDGFHATELARKRLPTLTAVVEWTDRHRLLPNAYVQGFLLGQAKAQQRAGYLMGEIKRDGWWYYFPMAMMIKTPLVLLALALMGVVAMMRRGPEPTPNPSKEGNKESGLPSSGGAGGGFFATIAGCMWWWLPVAVFLGSAMAAKLNIGLRHVLPVYPFLLLAAGAALAELLRSRLRWVRTLLIVVAAVDLATVYPDPLAFFNLSIGGPRHGDEYLVDSNLDWGQDLKRLKRWMDENRVEHINLSYFGMADPAYYGINCAFLPGSPLWADESVALPKLPGYVAVSVTNLRAVYLPSNLRNLYKSFEDQEPAARIGHSIRVYYAEKK